MAANRRRCLGAALSLALLLSATVSGAPGSGGQPLWSVSLDEAGNQLVVSGQLGDGSNRTVTHDLAPDVPDGFCIATYPSRLEVFTFGDRGMLRHWLLTPDASELLPLRDIPGVVEPSDCYVDSARTRLYVLEEGMGVWRYGALAGDDYERSLVTIFEQGDEREDFTLREGDLFAGELRIVSGVDRVAEAEPLSVTAAVETTPVFHRGDTADDPAIWPHPEDPQYSFILGADKRHGLRVYNLAGAEVQTIPAGRINNIDLRPLKDHPRFHSLAAGSNRTLKSISLFGISAEGQVTWLRGAEIHTGLEDPYGLCMYDDGAALHIFVNDKNGRLQQWRLDGVDESIIGTLVTEIDLPSQPEGCVADDAHGRLFYGLENSGIMILKLPAGESPRSEELARVDGRRLVADIEGMDLYLAGEEGYLVVSSQGNNSYVLFDRLPPHRYRGSFQIRADASTGIDGTSDTDGLAAHAGPLGERYPEGVLVVQDGYNVMPRENQNFKLVDWRDIRRALGL